MFDDAEDANKGIGMSYTIRIVGLQRVQSLLGQDFGPVMGTISYGIAAELENKIAPYPPATIANSPSMRHWYERGYGPRWRRKNGSVGGRRTSQIMNRQWYKERRGQGAVVGNRATYSAYLHSEKRQVGWAGPRGWITDRTGIERLIASGSIVRIILQAVRAKLGRR